MDKLNIVFLDEQTIGESVSLEPIRQLGNYSAWQSTEPHQTIERMNGADVVITNKVKIGRREMDACPGLKLICVAATGTNCIDMEYAAAIGLPVRNAVNYSTESVAQTTLMQVLRLVGRADRFDRYVKSGAYSGSNCFTEVTTSWFELRGKTYGIIGLGNIGGRVAQLADSFGMDVVYYPTSGKAHSDRWRAETDFGRFLSQCDIISVHCPLNSNTDGLVGAAELKVMKSGAYLVNMGRGGIVVEKDLADALDNGVIAGAAMDVYTKEPLPADHPFLTMVHRERILLTPHIAWASLEARNTLVEKIAENIRALL